MFEPMPAPIRRQPLARAPAVSFAGACARPRGLTALTDAAIAASEVVDLHLVAGRESELPSLTATLVELFRDAGLPLDAMEPFASLRAGPMPVASRARTR